MGDYLTAMAIGYVLTIFVETLILLTCLSRRHSLGIRLFAGVWLTACTYPVVWLVLPGLFTERRQYLIVAESFAPIAECAIFWGAFIRGCPPDKRATRRDMVAVTAANLASFGVGALFHETGMFSKLMSLVTGAS
jgi:hypothetical protein